MKCTFPLCRFCKYLVWSPKEQDFTCVKEREMKDNEKLVNPKKEE